MRWLLLVIFCWFGLNASAQSTASFPAKPTRYVSDRAFALDETQIGRLNARLENFERETSNQLVVAIFSRLPPQAEIAQYSTQVFRTWQIGQAGKDNGVGLFIFKDDRKLFIATGRGLEGALPDLTCKQIIDNEIVPHFKAGDFPAGVEAGVDAIIAATQGENRGTGKTVDESRQKQASSSGLGGWIVIAFVILYVFSALRRGSRNMLVNRRGYRSFGGSWISGGNSSGGGWGSGGGGGGFSGGGGSSGGGGAGGSW